MKKSNLTRRRFIGASSAVAAVTIAPASVLGGARTPPSEKLNIAGVGIGGRGFSDLRAVASENIVALCDVDQRYADRVFKTWPAARRHVDFRKMLDTQRDIEAVMVATPDHLHAFVTLAAIGHGKHVYCEKPLTHSVAEARAVGEAARRSKVATQMGNQGQASEEARRVRELIAAGAIGKVREVHAWSNRNPDISERGVPRPKETPPVPSTLDWNLWVGPARMRPYHPTYLPFRWRGWWDFGTGVLGDIGCHQLSTIFKALKLGHPESVESCSTNWQRPKEISEETAPLASITHYRFASSEHHGPLSIFWYDGGMRPPRPEELEPGVPFAVGDGILYVGEEGKMLGSRLIPESRRRAFPEPPKTLPRSPGHHAEWLLACKGGPAAGSNFPGHAAHLAEVVLLGNIAIRTNSKLYWDPKNMKFPGRGDAERFIDPPYRKGWNR